MNSHVKGGFVKGDKTIHILLMFFRIDKIYKSGELILTQS